MKEPRRWNVMYYYLATGMEGRADERYEGIFLGDTAQEAIENCIKENYKHVKGDRNYTRESALNWIRGCLSATEV